MIRPFTIAEIERIERSCVGSELPCSTYEIIRRSATNDPDGGSITFLVSGELEEPVRELSHAQLLGRIHQLANLLGSLGVSARDVVSCLLPNTLNAQVAFWGAQAAAIVNPINFLLGPRQIADILNSVQARVLIAAGPRCDATIWQKVEGLRRHVPGLEAILVIGGERDVAGGVHDFDEAVASAPADTLVHRGPIASDDVAAIFHTSGSTGHPKLVRHSHRNEVAAAWSTAQLFGFGARDVIMNGLPLFHVAAPILLSLAPWVAGARILLPTPEGMRNRRVLQNYWKIVERHRVTIPGGVPTTLLELTQVPVGDADLSSARFAVTGGAPLSRGLSERFTQHTGLDVRQMYGMTETAGIIAGAPPAARIEPGQVGLRAPGVELRIVRPDGSVCGAGERGEVHVRGANVSADGTPAAGRDGWFNTGDVGCIDAAGVLTLTGRTKDVIIRSGHNIDPATIEAVAGRHAAVKTCAAVGQPDKRAGEVPVLFVVLEAGATTDPDELKEFVAGQVAEAPAKPARVFVVDALPLNAVGKVFRPQLRCQAIAAVIHAEIDEVIAAAGLSCTVGVALDDRSTIRSRIEVERGDTDLAVAESCRARVLARLDQYPIDLSIEFR